MVNNNPLISIIVPIYNAEMYLSKCIESIVAQTYSHFELLLIDDGSKDNSLMICNNFAKQNNKIKVFTHSNSGVSATRNRGIELAQGEYITFVDSDDWIKPDYLQVLYDALQPSLGYGLIIASLERCSIKTNNTFVIPTVLLKADNISHIITKYIDDNIYYVCSKLYLKKILIQNNIRFLTNIFCYEDLLFALDYAEHIDYINIINKHIYCYSVTDGNQCLSAKINTFRHEMQTLDELLQRLNHYQIKYKIENSNMDKVCKTITNFIHKILLSVYKNNYDASMRMNCLRDLVNKHHQIILYYYKPDYMADKIAALFLKLNKLYAFDLWQYILFKLNFPKMYRA